MHINELTVAATVLLVLTLTGCENVNVVNTPDVRVANTPLSVVAVENVEPFAFRTRINVKVNNPFDDFQAVIAVPEGKIVIVEYVSASVFGDVRTGEEFELYVSGAAWSDQVLHRPRHFVTKLTRTDRVSRIGSPSTHYVGAGLVRTYAIPSKAGLNTSINLSVTSNIAVTPARDLHADLYLSGRLVDANE